MTAYTTAYSQVPKGKNAWGNDNSSGETKLISRAFFVRRLPDPRIVRKDRNLPG
jgi:hypothetical protein